MFNASILRVIAQYDRVTFEKEKKNTSHFQLYNSLKSIRA